MASTSNTQVESVLNRSRELPTCNEHNKDGCEFMCKKCRVPICRECIKTLAKGPHAMHDLEEVHEAFAAAEKEFLELKQTIIDIDKEKDEVRMTVDQKLMKSKDGVINRTKDMAKKIIEQAIKWCNDTIDTISDEFEGRKRQLSMQNDDMKKKKELLENQVQQL